MLKKAILFLVFNRLDTVQQVLDSIKKAQPPRFYIACDGARENKEGEDKKVQNVRDYILTNIDWKCEVKTLFQEKNLGCEKAVTQAINWFFDNEEDGIILEDDCLPNQSFYTYCETLLDYYKDNEQVMHISGTHYLDFKYGKASYYFSTIQDCWGWATWSKAWKQYDFSLEKYPIEVIQEKLFSYYRSVEMQDYWKKIYIETKNNKVNSWAYRWVFAIIANDGLCIDSNSNLVSNIGFSSDSTHTSNENDPLANVPLEELSIITHPETITRNMYVDECTMKKVFGIDNEIDQKLKTLERKVERLEKPFKIFKPLYFWIKKITTKNT